MSDKLLHGTASYRDYSKLRYILVKTGARKLERQDFGCRTWVENFLYASCRSKVKDKIYTYWYLVLMFDLSSGFIYKKKIRDWESVNNIWFA